jgi:hypothetical protein
MNDLGQAWGKGVQKYRQTPIPKTLREASNMKHLQLKRIKGHSL